jgi:hypothetical protein
MAMKPKGTPIPIPIISFVSRPVFSSLIVGESPPWESPRVLDPHGADEVIEAEVDPGDAFEDEVWEAMFQPFTWIPLKTVRLVTVEIVVTQADAPSWTSAIVV